jgi:ABC-type glycerol-3-phosphate transport system permease component
MRARGSSFQSCCRGSSRRRPAFLLCKSEYLFALAFLTQTQLKTMPLLLSAFFSENVIEWRNVMAGSALMTLPTSLLLFLPLQTRMASGLAAGAVKQ